MKRTDPQARQENFFYLVIWGMIFFLVPTIIFSRWLSGHSATFEWDVVLWAWKEILPFLILFLVHNYLIAPLMVNKRKTGLYCVLTAALFLLFSTFTILTHDGPARLGRPAPPPERLAPAPDERFRPEGPGHRPDAPEGPGHGPGGPESKPPITPETMIITMGLLLLGANLGAKYFFESRRNELRIQQLKTEHLNNQLEYLRYQINPHFFMNTLNNIHALVDIDPEKAKESIEEFSKLMRYVLYDGDRPTIPLERELDYLRHFISLMQIRYADSVRIETDFPDETPGAEIPPLLLASFVENAFKHGISYERASFVEVRVTLSDGSILFCCDNSRQGIERQRQHGIGLANVRKRLDLIYGDGYTLDITEDPDIYKIRLQIPATPETLKPIKA